MKNSFRVRDFECSQFHSFHDHGDDRFVRSKGRSSEDDSNIGRVRDVRGLGSDRLSRGRKSEFTSVTACGIVDETLERVPIAVSDFNSFIALILLNHYSTFDLGSCCGNSVLTFMASNLHRRHLVQVDTSDRDDGTSKV